MNKYYYNDGFRDFGPFELPELLHQKMRPDFKVREENETDWIRADQHEHLQALYNSTPSQSTDSKQSQDEFQRVPHVKVKAHWRDKVLLGTLSLSLFLILFRWLIDFLINITNFYPQTAIFTFTRFLYLFIPFGIALGIKHRSLRIAAFIIAALLALHSISTAIEVFAYM